MKQLTTQDPAVAAELAVIADRRRSGATDRATTGRVRRSQPHLRPLRARRS